MATNLEKAAKDAAAAQEQLNTEILQQELQNAQAGIEAYRQGTQERLEQLQLVAQLSEQVYGADSVDAVRKANTQVLAEQRAVADAQIEQQRGVTEALARETQSRIDLIHKQIAISDDYLAELVKEEREIQQLSDFAVEEYTKSTNAAAAGQRELAKLNDKVATEYEQKWRATASGVASLFSNSINQMMAGTFRFSSFVLSIGESIVTSTAKQLAESVLKYEASEAAKTAATAAGAEARATSETAASSQGLLMSGAMALKQILNNAYTAASAAFSATAAIPYVGPILAGPAAAAAFAAVMAFGSSVSAEGGYDIPAGINPLVQTHQNEMILPAPLAETIRNMARNGQSGGGAAAPNVNINVSAWDGSSVDRWLRGGGAKQISLGIARAHNVPRPRR
jgi:hypothetical protein